MLQLPTAQDVFLADTRLISYTGVMGETKTAIKMAYPCWVCTYVCMYEICYVWYIWVYVSACRYIRMCGFACVYVGLPKYVWYDCRNKSPWKQHYATTCDWPTSSQGKGKQLPWLPMATGQYWHWRRTVMCMNKPHLNGGSLDAC